MYGFCKMRHLFSFACLLGEKLKWYLHSIISASATLALWRYYCIAYVHVYVGIWMKLCILILPSLFKILPCLCINFWHTIPTSLHLSCIYTVLLVISKTTVASYSLPCFFFFSFIQLQLIHVCNNWTVTKFDGKTSIKHTSARTARVIATSIDCMWFWSQWGVNLWCVGQQYHHYPYVQQHLWMRKTVMAVQPRNLLLNGA